LIAGISGVPNLYNVNKNQEDEKEDMQD